MTWDILIPTIPQRHCALLELLAELNDQMRPGAGVRVGRSAPVSAGGPSIGEKVAALAVASRADYVCTLDDDDWVADAYIETILAALESRPDYVGFQVSYAVDGGVGQLIDHSLRHGRWVSCLVRDISDLNPMRRDLFLQGNFMGSLPGHPPGGHGNDRHWAASLRGKVKTQEYIPAVMYYYRYSTADNYVTPRENAEAPSLPSYPWLTVTDG